MHEVGSHQAPCDGDRYRLAKNTELLLGAERPLFFVPGAGQMTLASKTQKWTQWGPSLIVDEYVGWYREALQLRETVVIGDWSPIHKFNVSGPDVHAFMRYIQTRKDFADIEVGQSMYTVMVREDGKVVQDPLITLTSEDEYVITTDEIESWLHDVSAAGSFDVRIEDIRMQYCLMSVQGPNSTALMNDATGQSTEKLRFSRRKEAAIAGVPVEILRQGFTGEVGYEIYVEAARTNEVIAHLVEVGHKHGLGFLGNYTSRLTRAEAGLVMLHFDYQCAFEGDPGILRRNQMDPEMSLCSPFELNLDYLIGLDRDDDFVGKAALQAEIDAGGPARRMRGLVWNSEDVIDLFAAQFRDEPSPPPIQFPHPLFPEAHPIVHEGEQVGWATSVCYSPTLRRVFSFGRIDVALTEPGTEVVISWGGGGFPTMEMRATVADPPFVSRRRAAALA